MSIDEASVHRTMSLGVIRLKLAEHELQGLMSEYEKSVEARIVEKRFKEHFHWGFLVLLRGSGLWRPCGARWVERVAYQAFLRFILWFCVGLCAWRLFTRGLDGPAFHSVNSDLPFLMLHIWLVTTYPVARRLLHSAYFVKTLAPHKSRPSHADEVRKTTRYAALISLVFSLGFSACIVVGWAPGFVKRYYTRGTVERRVFGWLSFGSFLVIIVPWSCVLICFGAIFMITLTLLESDLIGIYEALFAATDDTLSFSSANNTASTDFAQCHNSFVYKRLSEQTKSTRRLLRGWKPATPGNKLEEDDVVASEEEAVADGESTDTNGDEERTTTIHEEKVVAHKDPHEPAMITKSRYILQTSFRPRVLRFERTLKGVCHMLDLPLSLIIVIGLLLIWLPTGAWNPPHSWRGLCQLGQDNPFFLVRDFFLMFCGVILIYLTLYCTSVFTENAKRLSSFAANINIPNAVVSLEVGRAIDRVDFAFTILGFPITRAFLFTFLELLALILTIVIEVFERNYG